MDRTAIRKALLGMLENNKGEPVEHLDDGMDLRQDLGLDSVDLVSLVVDIQDHFHLQVAIADFEKVQSVGDLLDLLQARLPVIPRAAA